MNRSTDSIQSVFNPLKAPFPVEKDPVIDDLHPLALRKVEIPSFSLSLYFISSTFKSLYFLGMLVAIEIISENANVTRLVYFIN